MKNRTTTSLTMLALVICSTGGFAQQRLQGRQQVVEETPKAALEADLHEAISMLDRKQYQLLMYDFLPGSFASRRAFESRQSRTGLGRRNPEPPPILSVAEVKDLKAAIRAALSGKRTYDRNQTLVEITYIKKPVELIPATKPGYIPAATDRPSGPIHGLGSDLKRMLTQAAALLDSGKQEEFVRSVYPLPELANLAQADNMQRLLSRLKSQPKMAEAMIRDLTAAAAADNRNSGATTDITLPAIDKQKSGRILKFELVEGNWRFFDGGKQHRNLYRQLTSASIGSHTVPGSKGSMVLYRFNGNWRLHAMPANEPLTQ
ncbi:MAG TPA: hypothetical protein EYG03_16920 [Planctomycetes bacterium]|nr:hypothetical protein [Planctomycetota bacterium]